MAPAPRSSGTPSSVRTIEHNGVPILVYDFSRTTTRGESLARVAEARGMAARHGPGQRTLTDVREAFLDAEVVRALGALAQENAPYVDASAVVGAKGQLEQARQLVAGLTGRRFEAFDDAGAALDWLAPAP